MNNITEPDWKIAKALSDIALARAFDRAVADLSTLINDVRRPSRERFWNVHDLVTSRNKAHVKMFDDFRRSSAIFQLSLMKREDLLTDEEIARLSRDARDALAKLLEFYG